ncbi:MAG: methylenetetrahydrofolate reductase [NAD(P)H] [Dehalococcoidia bacterium]|nr:methylenetetrahydrofolate reductase [NAD(P)H] [Dehalococcoidia bacterium]MDD5495198.1 methylenetetrahydrofolate reductase [NAD(P)H] [Dehalococcoidia bacterium]
MKISEIIAKQGKSLSFEFFPPKTPIGEDRLLERINKLEAFSPSFVSFTQHAGRNTLEKTKHIVRKVHDVANLTVMPHITCADPRRVELQQVIDYYKESGIENILALRGDPEEYEPGIFDGETHFRYATDLVKFVATYNTFCIGVAVYPEGHMESANLAIDTAYTKKKIDEGAEFGITQMFFENYYYYEMVDRFEQAGIKVPIIAGIMPIIDFAKVERFSEISGVELPIPLITKFEEAQPDDVLQMGIELASEQCLDLWENGVRYFHFYTLNRGDAVTEILNNLASTFS